MSVDIEPFELGFRRPFNVEVAQTLKIKNPNTSPVAFKVKTTAPKQYCVRPNSGRIEPDHEVEVSVLLQAMKQEPPMDTKCRDKFLVQSVLISPEMEFNNIQAIWDSAEKSAVQEKKIRVIFLPPSGATLSTPMKNGPVNGNYEATPEAPPPAFSSPAQDSHAPSSTAHEDASELKHESSPEPSNASGVTAAVASAAEQSYDELKAKLAQANAKIASLTQEGGLRQRKTAGGDKEKSKPQELATAVRQGTEGVPVQIVAALCLVTFLLAYFFF